MSVLPREIPTAVLVQLTALMAGAGITVGPLRTGKRLTHPATYAGTTWDISYLGLMMGDPVWSLIGPGIGHGMGCTAEDAVEHILANSVPVPAPVKPLDAHAGAPRTHSGVPVPEDVRAVWDTDLGAFWRFGVRSAIAAR